MDRTVGRGSCCRTHRGGRHHGARQDRDETDDQVGAAADLTYAGAAIAVGKVKADWPGSPRGRGSSALIVDQTDRLPSHWREVLLSAPADGPGHQWPARAGLGATSHTRSRVSWRLRLLLMEVSELRGAGIGRAAMSDQVTSSENSARRAGNNSPPRSNCRPAPPPGPAQCIAHSFAARSRCPYAAAGCSATMAFVAAQMIMPVWSLRVGASSSPFGPT